MNVDRSSFLMLVTTLAAGGAVGYVAAEKRVFPPVDRWVGRTPEPGTEPIAALPPAAPPPPVSVAVAPPPPPAPAGPVCDDSTATAVVGDCPGPGLPTVEGGGCGSFASVRCGDLKTALKPKVASAAVACITKLNGQERCDANRVQLCGHLALMNACPDVAPPGVDAGPNETPVARTCQSIIDSCGASPIAPSLGECRQLLSGMTDVGRERTKKCMATHCFDRGLVGCEGIDPPPKR